ncbi:MAG: DinB family protein [Bryobacterales bacterium]|nr:DinB family protein [Bryobacterales bacterium]
MSELAELLERFRRGPEVIASALTGAAGAELDFVPGPGKWSVRQILCHMADADIVAAVRFRRIIAEEKPPVAGYDQDAWGRNLNYASLKTAAALEMFRQIRAWSYELLSSLPESAFDRKCLHPERGEMSLKDWLAIYARHAEKHAEQMRNVRAAYKESRSA